MNCEINDLKPWNKWKSFIRQKGIPSGKTAPDALWNLYVLDQWNTAFGDCGKIPFAYTNSLGRTRRFSVALRCLFKRSFHPVQVAFHDVRSQALVLLDDGMKHLVMFMKQLSS